MILYKNHIVTETEQRPQERTHTDTHRLADTDRRTETNRQSKKALTNEE